MPHQEGVQTSSEDDIPPLGRDEKEKKRPIPLPRSKLNVDCDSESSTSSSKRSFRKRIRSASENINGTVLEGTKQVRTKLKRVLSRPGSLHKRNSVFHATPEREDDRRQSLPAGDDIFTKISFASPLDLGTQIKHWRGDFNYLNSLDETRAPCDTETGDSETMSDVTSIADSSVFYYDGDSTSLPPPSFPPPPLPRDDVSECSSVSGSSYYTVGTLDTKSFCDEVLDSVNRRLSNFHLPIEELSREPQNGWEPSNSHGLPNHKQLPNSNGLPPSKAHVERSESWSFQEGVSSDPWSGDSWLDSPDCTRQNNQDPWRKQDAKPSDKANVRPPSTVPSQYYETVVLTIVPPSHPTYTSPSLQPRSLPSSSLKQNTLSTHNSSHFSTPLSSPSLHLKNPSHSSPFSSPSISSSPSLHSKTSPNIISSSEIVSSESSGSHQASVSILSSSYPNSTRSSDYDNHKLRSTTIHPTSKSSSHSYENWEVPVVPNRKEEGSGDGDFYRPSSQTSSQSSTDPAEPTPTETRNSQLRHSQSVIFEFDPLSNFMEMRMPEPPKRVDSITEETRPVQDTNTFSSYLPLEQDKCVTPERQTDSPTGRKRLAWTSMKQVIRNLTDTTTRRGSKGAELLLAKDPEVGALERPAFSPLNTCIYNGPLYKDMQMKYFQLAEGKLFWASDKNSPNKELFGLDTMMSIKRIPEVKQTSSGEDVHCFSVSTSQSKAKSFVLGATCTSERRLWMQKLLESCTQVFSTKVTSDYLRAGWCSLKEGVTNEWSPAWVVLQARVLFYSLHESKVVYEVDLKKSRSIERQEDTTLPNSGTDGQMILVDTPSQVLYLQMGTAVETQAWKQDMRGAATNNGPLLVDQQLTRDEIPTLVDKCLNFVFTHGSMSEGIYRRSGSNSNVSKLLADLRRDAWQVQLSREEYSEHDVSTVLKRFFRDLPEPLLSTELHKYLCNAAGMDCSPEDKVHIYRSLLEKLHPIHYVTVRKLMGHLYFIQEKRDINKMSVENLASIWGPTLMHVESKDSLEWSKREAEALVDLISFYPKLFHVEEEEMAREREMMQVLERYHNSAVVTPQVNKPSGDLKVWIYLGSKDSNNCVNVELDPSKEAGQVCKELCGRLSPPAPSHDLCLMEVVCEGSLTRCLHHKEKVLLVVLEWGYWDEADRKDNALVLCSNQEWRNEIAPMFKQPQAVSGDLKFADRKSKSFKSYLFEFSQSKLCYYKDKKGSVKLGEWRIEDIIWYLGHEKKRSPNTRWSLTFVPHHKIKRSKDTPWFGYTIAGCNKEEQYKWMAAMLFGQYGASDLLPKADLM